MELLTLTVIGLQIAVFLLMPFSKFYFLTVFVFFRIAYNGGLGWLLSQQSKSRYLVKLCEESGLFDPESKDKKWS